MDNALFTYIGEKHIPKLNPLIANGLAVEHIKHIEGYVDRVLRCVAEGCPEGFEYLGMEHCTPKEEYHEIVRRKNSKRTFEIARSDVYMVKLHFAWKGERITRFLDLPFVRDGGLINILGALYSISPVLMDKGISVGLDHIFVPLTCTKLTFERVFQHFFINQQRASEFVVWSNIYRRSAESVKNQGRPTMKANSTLAHYLFCKFGLHRTFSQFGLTHVEVGTSETINEKTHPTDKWFICSSTQIKPVGLGKVFYQGSDIRLAVKQKDWTPLVAGLVAGFFYVIDMFPTRIKPEYIDGTADETNLWRILMGHVIFASDISEGKLLVDIDIHIEYLDGYIDAMAKEELASANLMVNDFYDLLVHIISTFPERIMGASESIGSMYGKRLSVLRYIAMPITSAAFNMMFKLRKMVSKPTITRDDVVNLMNKFLKTDLIKGINRDHGEVRPISSSSDNKAFNITNAIVLQANSNGAGGAKVKSSLFDPGRHLNASVAELGSLTHLPKSEPSGRSRFNLCAKVGPDGSVERDPNKAALIDSVQEKIKR